MSERDRRILEVTRALLDGGDFREALRCLHEATARTIPNGRTYFLGRGPLEPVIGSIISGIGLTPTEHGLVIVRVDRMGVMATLGRFSP